MSSSQLEQTTRLPDLRPAELSGSRGDFLRARSVKRDLLRRLGESHDAGSPLAPEDLLPHWPADPGQDRDVASLLFEDYCRREHRGESPSLADYQERFPGQRDSLLAHVRRHGVMRSLRPSDGGPAPLSMPGAGDEVFGFRLRHELGRGAFACVFLAEQVELAGRPVVLKISADDGKEPQTLAQLQHTHIVPIYSHHEDRAAGLRAVCMPFFGGASLSRVLSAIWVETSQPVSGDHLVRALQSVQAPTLGDLAKAAVVHPATAAPSPPTEAGEGETDGGVPTHATLDRLARGSYLQAAAWLVACLADGLHHAHERGILHRDIKPSNVLIGADGQPLLLDFNLSTDVKEARTRESAALGGTVAYMAPEHLGAMASRDPAQARKVDRRSDIYSLGMVLFEMLVGHKPFDQSASYAPMPALIEAMAVERAHVIPSVRERRPDVPWGLESVLRKCLHPDPQQRYQRADHLAEDLRALLNDRPLRHAPELSRAERMRKWSRRHPRVSATAAVGGVAVGLLLSLSGVLAWAWSGWEDARDQLSFAGHLHEFDENAVRAFCLISTTAELQGLDHHRRGLDLCRRSLDLYGVLDRDDWQQAPGWARLDKARRLALLESVREVLLLYAWALARTEEYRPDVLHEALALLAKAERIGELPPTAALWEDRAFYLEKLGRGPEALAARERARATPPATARDFYLLATTRIRTEGPASEPVLAALDQALRLNPQHFWALMQRGACRLEKGDTLLAVSDFSEAIRLRPDAPLAYFNRGYALARAGRHAAAAADYAAALERDPEFVLASLNRGLIFLEMKQFAPALADFDRAVAMGRDDAPVHAGRGMALEGSGQSAEADAAFARAFARLDRLDEKARLRLLWVYGFTVSARLPGKAREAFDAVLAAEPANPQALYGRAMLAANEDHIEEALALFQRALHADPTFVEARRFRAVLLARRGAFDKAGLDINACLEKEPHSGPTLYAAACVAALALEHAAPLQAGGIADQALVLLEQAFRQRYGQDRAAADPDLAPLRTLPAFQQLITRKF
jgi:serine/threonine protein kinase/Flp pilus assembly protein TadD